MDQQYKVITAAKVTNLNHTKFNAVSLKKVPEGLNQKSQATIKVSYINHLI